MEAEYWQATEGLKLPEGTEWSAVVHPLPMPDDTGVPRGHSYEPGYGVALAYQVWFCAWQREWLAQRGKDLAREAEALAELRSYPEFERYHEFNDPQTQVHHSEMLRRADLGDPGAIARNAENNCSEPVLNASGWSS